MKRVVRSVEEAPRKKAKGSQILKQIAAEEKAEADRKAAIRSGALKIRSGALKLRPLSDEKAADRLAVNIAFRAYERGWAEGTGENPPRLTGNTFDRLIQKAKRDVGMSTAVAEKPPRTKVGRSVWDLRARMHAFVALLDTVLAETRPDFDPVGASFMETEKLAWEIDRWLLDNWGRQSRRGR